MAEPGLDGLIRSIQAVPVPATITDLKTRRVIALNEPAIAILGGSGGDLVGTDAVTHFRPEDQEAVRKGFQALADRVVDGYEAHRTFVSPSGAESKLATWGRRVEGPGWEVAVWMLLPTVPGANPVDAIVAGPAEIVLALTDHDWQLEYVSADAELLVAPQSARRGFPLLGLVHPSVASEFLTAAGRAVADRVAVTVLTRMRTGSDEWAPRHCLMVPMCEHEPPRLGVVITSAPSEEDPGAARTGVAHDLRHTAMEAKASHALHALPPLARMESAPELTARQIEIVSRLASGQRIADIAAAMFLSASTVRNHLTAIYRKFGVHSQAELLAALLQASTSGTGIGLDPEDVGDG